MMRPSAPPAPHRLRVLHVASGGFSGATQVALDLTRGGQPDHDTLLVLRLKRRTPMARVQRLQQEGVPLALVPGWSHAATVWGLRRLCREWQPDIVVGHGFPEHLLARWAAWWTGVPVRIQVEHNMRERYTAFKRWQAARLAPHTQAFIGVSDAVSSVLRGMGLPAERIHTIRNGTDLKAYADSAQQPFETREPAILMAARFGAQKDHDTLIRSLVPLQQVHGLRPTLRLAGGGSTRHRQRAQALVAELGLQDQVEFLGHRSDVPALLMRHQVAVLSTHYEGMPLSLAEAMAAGCVVVGSDVAAVRETLGDGRWGHLAAHGDAQSWASVLATVLRNPAEAAVLADRGRAHARASLTRERMVLDYRALFERLVATHAVRAVQPMQTAPAADAERPDPTEHPKPRSSPTAPPTDAPWLSVLIPAHNAGPYLAEALASVLPQLDERAEVIVFDDATTDESRSVLQSAPQAAAPGRPRVRVLSHPTGVGVSAARNALLDAARGRWLWFLDADDRLRTGAIAGLSALLDAHSDLQAVVVDHAVLRQRSNWKHRLRGEAHRRSMIGPEGRVPTGVEGLRRLMACGQWHIWGKVIRRDAWPDHLRFPEGRVFEDLSVVPRLMATVGPTWYWAQPLVEYRSNPGSILGSMSTRKLHDWLLALDDLLNHPRFDDAWADFIVQQAGRLARVADRLEAHTPPGSRPRFASPHAVTASEPGEASAPLDPTAWWHRACERQPTLRAALAQWRWQPRRWAAYAQARQRGWLNAPASVDGGPT